MNKTEFISALASHGGITKKEAELFLQAFQKTLEENLPKTGRIALSGIGTFEIAKRAARKGRNPATGEEIDIPARKSVKFKAAKNLDTLVQWSYSK